MAVLRSRLLDIEQRKQFEETTEERRSQIGTGERSEKIRTYNFPQDRITDHRISLTLHNLPHILDGELDEVDAPVAVRLEETAEPALVDLREAAVGVEARADDAGVRPRLPLVEAEVHGAVGARGPRRRLLREPLQEHRGVELADEGERPSGEALDGVPQRQGRTGPLGTGPAVVDRAGR